METLFFSNPSREEYEALFLNGSRRRQTKNSKKNSDGGIQIQRATKPAEPAICKNTNLSVRRIKLFNMIYNSSCVVLIVVNIFAPTLLARTHITSDVIDNFLTETELEYFNKKMGKSI